MTTIPAIDLEPWYRGDHDDRRAVAAAVDEQLRRLGFLLVVNHGLDRAILDECRRVARAFFHGPVAAKARYGADDGRYRGWIGPGRESNAATYGVDTPPDLKETFAIGAVDLADPMLAVTAPEWFAENIWPVDQPDFQPAVERWWRAGRVLADELLRIFAMALGLPTGYLVDRCRATTATGTINWYGPRSANEPEAGQFRIGPHTDFGTVTILDREPGLGGLQVLDEAGNWIDAPFVDGALLVNTGDMLRRWTNDRWCSNEHRVLPPPAEDPAEELISLVFFHEPDHDTVVEALPTCVSAANPARHLPIRADAYLAEKFAALAVTTP